MAAEYDIEGRQGNSLSLTFQFVTDTDDTPLDLTGSSFVFTAVHRSGTLQKASADDELTVDAFAGQVTLDLTAAETRALPAGALTTYELEQRLSGAELTLMAGRLIIAEGINDDV